MRPELSTVQLLQPRSTRRRFARFAIFQRLFAPRPHAFSHPERCVSGDSTLLPLFHLFPLFPFSSLIFLSLTGAIQWLGKTTKIRNLFLNLNLNSFDSRC